MIKKRLLFLLATSMFALVSACGGGGGGGSLPSASTGSSGTPGSTPISPPTNAPSSGATAPPNVTMALTVTIPGKKSSSRARGPQYIAPNSGSMTMTLLTVNGVAVTGTAQGPYNLTPGPTNPNCVVATNTTCTFQISAPVGTDIFLANTYTTSNGTGQPLGSGSILLSVKQNAQNSANLSLTGPVNAVQVVSATTVLYNGNPVPAPQCSDCAIARGVGAQAAAMTPAQLKSRAASATRKPAGAVTSSGPVTPGPVATSSRIFVIALDAAGNQIINPTTFDIPITLTLSLNGLPAGQATLSVTYAGLSGEPASPASTSSDGGTVVVFAPSDTVTMTVSGTIPVSPFLPTVVAGYTPQGGAAQTSVPLTFKVFLPPPAGFLTFSASHVDPLTVGVPATLTEGVGNIGTAAASGAVTPITFYGYLYYLNVNNLTPPYDAPGSDPSWVCSPPSNGVYYYYVYCTSTAVIAPNGNLPLLFNVTPTGGSGTYAEADMYGRGSDAVNGTSTTSVYDTINVLLAGALTISPTAVSFSGTCPSAVPCGYSQTVSVYEFGYVGNINLSLGACPYFALNVPSVADDGVSTFPVVVTPILAGTVPSPATCTLTATDTNSNTATSALQNAALTVNVQ